MENFENLSFEEIINNEELVDNFIKSKQENFNYREFIFDTIPNYTFYEENIYDQLKNIDFKKINNIFEELVKNNKYKINKDKYSYFIKYPLQSLSFSEDFESPEIKEKIYGNFNSLKEVIGFIKFNPDENEKYLIESEVDSPKHNVSNSNQFNINNKDQQIEVNPDENEKYLIESEVDSPKHNVSNSNQFNTNNKDQQKLSFFTINVDDIQQLNPDKVEEFIDYSFEPNKKIKNSTKLCILEKILNTKNKEILERLANDYKLLDGILDWLKYEIKKPSSVLLFICEVLRHLPIAITYIKEYHFEKILNKVLRKRKKDYEAKKRVEELKESWKKLKQRKKKGINNLSGNGEKKNPTIINVKNSQKKNKTDLFDKILSAKIRPPTSIISSSNSNINTITTITTPKTTPTKKSNAIKNKFTIRKASNIIFNPENQANSNPIYNSPTEFIVGNNTYNNNSNNNNTYNNTLINNNNNIMVNSTFSKNPQKHILSTLNTINSKYSYKRLKLNSSDSLNNISFTEATAKPVTSILKKSVNKNSNSRKKHVSFKPDGVMTQYRIIFDDGRDLNKLNHKRPRFNK